VGTNAIIASLRAQLAERDAKVAELTRALAGRDALMELADRLCKAAEEERDQAQAAAVRMVDVCRAAAELTGYFDACNWSPEVKLSAGMYPEGTTLIPVREDIFAEMGAAVGSLLDLIDPKGEVRAEEQARQRRARDAAAGKGRKDGPR
jgi:hypothetical protein